MANIKIADLQPTQVEFAELSDLELETVIGGRFRIFRPFRFVVRVVKKIFGSSQGSAEPSQAEPVEYYDRN